MSRRIVGIIGAVILALGGTLALVGYVQSARDEAVAASDTVDVWVVRSAIAEGTPASAIEGSLERTGVPASLRAAGGVEDLDDLEGMVSSTELVPGDQLVASRFVSPAVARRGDVPAGLHQVTVELSPDRAMGGRVRAGDTVGVLMSFEPFDLEGTVPDDAGGVEQLKGKTGSTTHLTLHKVHVASVQIGPNASGVPALTGEEGADEATPVNISSVETAPTESLLVTLALDAPSVEQLVFAAEYGGIWLTAEPADAPEDGTKVVDRGNVYGGLR